MAAAQIKGGEELERALAELAAKLKTDKGVRVGFLEKATYPDGTKVALVAAVQNFGAPSRGIPPRPFFSNMVRDKSRTWSDAIVKNLKATNYDVTATLNRVGAGIKGQLQDSIRNFSGTPLAPATVKAKGFDKQLIATGNLLNSVDYEVK